MEDKISEITKVCKDEKGDCFTECLFEAMDLIDKDGNFHEERLPAEIRSLSKACYDQFIDMDDKCARAEKIAECFNKKD